MTADAQTNSDNTANSNNPYAERISKLHGTFPTMPDVPQDRPWRATYEQYGLSPTIDMPNDDTSLLDVFERNFARYGNKDAYICMNTSITYKELDNYSRQIAAYLQSLGLKKGDKVAAMMPNVLQYPIVALGVIRAGMILVNVNPLYTSRELEHQLHDSGAKPSLSSKTLPKPCKTLRTKDTLNIPLCSAWAT